MAQASIPCDTVIRYPALGQQYPPNDLQIFEFNLGPNYRFSLQIDSLQLASGDTLRIFDASFPNLPALVELVEGDSPETVNCYSNKVRLVFNSDASAESNGFIFTVKCLPPLEFQAIPNHDTLCAGAQLVIPFNNTFPYSDSLTIRYFSSSNQGLVAELAITDSLVFSIPSSWSDSTYTLFIEPTDSLWLGLADTLALTVEPLLPSPVITGDTVFCGNEITLSAMPALPVIWFFNGDTLSGEASLSINTSNTGIYQAQNLAGCGSMPSEPHPLILLNAPEAPLWLSENTIELCNGDTAQVDFTLVSGTAILNGPSDTLSVNPGTLRLFAPGNYWLSATNQCGSAFSDTLTINPLLPPPAFDMSYTGSLQLCENQQLLLSVPNADPSIFWLRDGLDISNGNPTLSVNSAGNYTASMSNVCGITWASDTLSVSIVELPEVPSLTAAGPTTLCEGNTVVLIADVEAGNELRWYSNNIELPSTSSTLQVNTSGTYTLSATNECGEVFAAQSIPVQINPLPQAPLLFTQGNPYLCNGSSVLIGTAVQQGVSWQWKRNGSNIPSQTNSITVNQPGLYTLVVSNGCGDSTSVNSIGVFSGSQPSAPVPAANGTTSFCEGNSVLLSTNPQNGVFIEWLLNGQVSGLTGFQVNAVAPGTYTVRVSNACDTLISSQSIPVTVFPLPPVVTFSDFELLSLCEGDSFIFEIDPLPGVSYQWRRNGQISGPNAPQYTIQQEGVYSLQLVNSCGSTPASYPVTVNVDSVSASVSEIVAQPSTALCPGGYVILNAQPVPFQTYNWYLNNALWSSGLASSIIATEWGTYTLQNSNACGASDLSEGITLGPGDPPPPFELFSNSGTVEFCENDSLLITAQVPFGVAIRWFLEGDSLSETSAQLWAKQPGNYTAVGWNGCGEINALNSITLSTLPAPPIPQITESAGILFTAGTGSIQWLDSAGVAITGANGLSFSPPPADGIYSVAITGANGCSSVSAPFVYLVNHTTGVLKPHLKLWPNPVSDQLLLSGAAPGSAFQILDVSGRVLAAGVFPADGLTQVPVSELSAGVYCVRSGLFMERFVKTNP
jgi:hypothetical protein